MEGLATLGINPMSILVYIVNIGILLLVLTKVLYKPILKFLDERISSIEDSVNQAENLRKEVIKKSQELEEMSKKSDIELKKVMDDFHAFEKQKRAEFLLEMEKTRAEMLAKSEQEVAQKLAGILRDAEKTTMDLIQKIVLHIVRNKIPKEVVEHSVKEAWTQIQSN